MEPRPGEGIDIKELQKLRKAEHENENEDEKK
jgi:hypothetical protein